MSQYILFMNQYMSRYPCYSSKCTMMPIFAALLRNFSYILNPNSSLHNISFLRPSYIRNTHKYLKVKKGFSLTIFKLLTNQSEVKADLYSMNMHTYVAWWMGIDTGSDKQFSLTFCNNRAHGPQTFIVLSQL